MWFPILKLSADKLIYEGWSLGARPVCEQLHSLHQDEYWDCTWNILNGLHRPKYRIESFAPMRRPASDHTPVGSSSEIQLTTYPKRMLESD